MMRTGIKERLHAMALLAVLLPVLFAAPFHHHDPAFHSDTECDACLHHQPHQGHLSGGDSIGDCLLCHFLCEPFVSAPETRLPSLPAVLKTEFAAGTGCFVRFIYLLTSPRAPPVSFCR